MRIRKPARSASTCSALLPAQPRCLQRERGDPAASNLWIRVLNRHHHPCYTGVGQRTGAGSCLPLMTAGFERDVGRRSGGITGGVEGHDLGVRLTRRLCKAGADLLIIAD